MYPHLKVIIFYPAFLFPLIRNDFNKKSTPKHDVDFLMMQKGD